MRPKSIARFELVYWLWLALSLGNVFLAWGGMLDDPQMRQVVDRMPWFPYLIMGVIALLLVWLGIAIARRGSPVGRWVFAIIAVLSVVLTGKDLAGGGFVSNAANWMGVGAAILAAIGGVLLFLPDASSWFGGYDDAVDEVVEIEP